MADDPSVATTEQPLQPSPEITPDGLLRAKGEMVAAHRRAQRGNPRFPPQRGKGIWIGAALFVAITGLFVLRAGVRDDGDLILPGVSVWNVPVGGLSPAEAKKTLTVRTAAALDSPLLLVDGSRSWTRTARQLGCGFDLDAAVAEAESLGRQGNILRRALDKWEVRRHGMTLKLQRSVDRKKLGEQLRAIAAQAHIPARQATIRFNGSNFLISSEQRGHLVDALESEKKIVRYFDPRVHHAVTLVSRPEEPRVRAAALRQINARLISFTTRYNPGNVNRTENLRLAAAALDGTVILPGDVFSYNQTVGPRSEERGYKVAKIFRKGEILDGLGGGVCQVATTVYNAAYEARLRILERARHSRPVTYAPPGRDATVSFGSVDLKFRNNTGAPLLIQTRTGGGRITVSLYGNRNYRARLEQRKADRRKV